MGSEQGHLDGCTVLHSRNVSANTGSRNVTAQHLVNPRLSLLDNAHHELMHEVRVRTMVSAACTLLEGILRIQRIKVTAYGKFLDLDRQGLVEVGHLFEIPLRCLTRSDFPNIITAGRSADGTGYGWDLIRVIPPAILTEQAAGETAALALKTGSSISSVNIRSLQDKLEKENVMIHFPDEYVPEDKTVIIHGKNAAEIEGGHL